MSNPVLFNDNDSDYIVNHPFTETDYEILKSYEAAVDGLSLLIGEHCEIVSTHWKT